MNWLLDIVLHLDKHLAEVLRDYGPWTYAILGLIIFCETGLVVTPFLPGDSLLFAAGALAIAGGLDPMLLVLCLWGAALLGDMTNYTIGYHLGPKLFKNENSRLFRKKHLDRTHAFYETYGGKTLILARFVPVVRTFAPFVAGIGRMTFPRFASFSVAGGFLWTASLVYAGYFFGSIGWVKNNFSIVVLMIVFISILPAVIEFVNARRATRLSR
jgi:membrane-associated protein